MFDRLKRWGEIAVALTAISAIFAALVSAFGGHLPPYVTWADGQTIQQTEQQNARQISQLNVVVLSDKVSQIQSALAKNPDDPNLRQSLSFWQAQLSIAMANVVQLPPPRH